MLYLFSTKKCLLNVNEMKVAVFPKAYLNSLSCRISTGSRPQGFWMGVMRFCLVWKGIMGVGCAGWPGDWVCGGITGEAAGGTDGRPVG